MIRFLGRFLTRDPFPGLLGLPATQQPYAYALNNPVMFTDPSGYFPLIDSLYGLGTPTPTPYPPTPTPPLPSPSPTPGPSSTSTPTSTSTATLSAIDTPTSSPTLPTPTMVPYDPANYRLPAQQQNNAFGIGVNVSGSNPYGGTYYTGGVEIIFFESGTIAIYYYGGEGASVGAGANAAIYLVLASSSPGDYLGHSASAGCTISGGDYGITAGRFWSVNSDASGYILGYAPGAKLSIWQANAIYNEWMTIK